MELTDKRFVKIVLYERYNSPISETVYFRSVIPQRILDKYMWYFDYLVALIKVKYPKKKVVLSYGVQNMLFGEDYIKEKIKNLISHKKGRITQLNKMPEIVDLFDDGSKKTEMINKLKNEIADLEKGIVNFYVPVEYINKIRLL